MYIMLTKSLSVPKPLWDALDSILQKKARELIKDIAKSCNQPEKKLWDVYKSQKYTVHLLDLTEPTEDKYECEALLPHSHVHTRCRKTVLYGKKYCPEHEFYQPSLILEKTSLQRCITEENFTVFIDKDTNTVYDANFKKIGIFQDKRIFMFDIEEEIEYS